MGYRKTGSTVIMVENTELTERVNNIEGELDKSNKQSVTLTHGLQVVNAEQNSTLDVSFEGRTLVNLLGKDGNFEGDLKNPADSKGATLDTSFSIYGKDSLKISGTSNLRWSKDYNVTDSAKYYVALVDCKVNSINGSSSPPRMAIYDHTTYNNFLASGNGEVGKTKTLHVKFTGKQGVRISLGRFVSTDDFDVNFDGLRLYEITQEEYNAIGTTWDDAEVARRYPYVDSVQHVQNPYVIAEGENLLPPFTEWTLHANAKVKSPYELELNATAGSQISSYTVQVKPSTQYYFTVTRSDATNAIAKQIYRRSDNSIISSVWVNSGILTTPSDCTQLSVELYAQISGTFTFTNPMLTLGNQSKPFIPRNPSTLYAELKLGALSDKKDILYKSDGEWYLRKNIEKDVKLDGSLGWVFGGDYTGFKLVRFNYSTGICVNDSEKVVKYNGLPIKNAAANGGWVNADHVQIWSDGILRATISDTDSGWGESYTPTANEIKAYFWGWRMCDGTYGNKWTGTGTKTWHPIADTDLNRAVTSVPTSEAPTITEGKIDYYKLSYALATPQTINVTDKVEGELTVNGSTQVEVGSGFTYVETDGQRDYTLLDGNDRYDVTTNLLSAPSTYNSSLKSVVDDVVAKQADISSTVSVHVRAIAELYKRVKALGG